MPRLKLIDKEVHEGSPVLTFLVLVFGSFPLPSGITAGGMILIGEGGGIPVRKDPLSTFCQPTWFIARLIKIHSCLLAACLA